MRGAWQSERLFFEGDDFFADVAKAIEGARKSVSLETYIFTPDAVGRQIETLLRSAAKRGIKVKLLVDGIGSIGWINQLDPGVEKDGVEVRIYHPVSFVHLVPRWDRQTATLAARLNRRTHRKMVLIDDETAYVGSVNVTAMHSQRVLGERAWRDTVLRVTGGAVDDLTRGFDNVWRRSHDTNGKRRWAEGLPTAPRKFPRPGPLVRLNFTVRLRFRGGVELNRSLKAARRKLWITNAYFAPSRSVVRAILQAAKNGADVRLLVPRNSDVFFMPWVATSHYKKLLKAGVRVYEYLPRFLHAKTMVVDDRILVGTSNLNRRSLFNDFEVDLWSNDAKTREELEKQFLKDLEFAEEITEARGGPIAFVGRWIARWFKNWI